MSNEKVNITKLKSELAYYKGFYEGVKEMTTLLGDGPIDINHNFNVSEEKKERPKNEIRRKVIIKDIRIFMNTIDKAIKTM